MSHEANPELRGAGTDRPAAHGGSGKKLVYMANQIATFFASQPHKEGVEGVATHINKFWEPRMRQQLFRLLEDGPDGFHPLVLECVPLIRRPYTNPNTGKGTGAEAEAGAPLGKGTAAGENKGDTNFPEMEVPSG